MSIRPSVRSQIVRVGVEYRNGHRMQMDPDQAVCNLSWYVAREDRIAEDQRIARVIVERSDGTGQEVTPEAALRGLSLHRQLMKQIAQDRDEDASHPQQENASRPRKKKDITRADLVKLRDKWVLDNGHERGWIKAAASSTGLSRDAIRKRIAA